VPDAAVIDAAETAFPAAPLCREALTCCADRLSPVLFAVFAAVFAAVFTAVFTIT
jgi:hypothetical protein